VALFLFVTIGLGIISLELINRCIEVDAFIRSAPMAFAAFGMMVFILLVALPLGLKRKENFRAVVAFGSIFSLVGSHIVCEFILANQLNDIAILLFMFDGIIAGFIGVLLYRYRG